MPAVTREIKRRIRSVANTKKITKAMELVAATKMRRAVKRVLETRSYASLAWEVIRDLSQTTDPRYHPLLHKRDRVKRIAVVVMASNRGLCGGFNREIVEGAVDYVKKTSAATPDVSIDFILLGKKTIELSTKYGYQVIAEFPKPDVATGINDISAVAKMVVDDFIALKYDLVTLMYTDYYSALRQEARVRQLLPIEPKDGQLGNVKGAETSAPAESYEYLFEPSPDAVLEQMLYKLLEMQMYQALLESNASEHSARMMSMRNASDAASDMIEDLTLTFNRARQASITAEIADIAGGKAAVE